ncbi:YitT family protein [Staphylococcus succinus]|uniref:YitT family protein n=1 Tax=Staphylococcus succinus TaxID=61015 RepID=A0A9Q6MUJ4_9STAP|nr:YitT family protein [Staphylococcus succinus]MEB8126298.1 YitT family protein [Staphylococcus succinus]MEB8209659.1 YitT family protein [Staphylococcus succinus]PTI43518.1 YitT family protein [Staphylococcus succinus]PTI75417.1 YitT family protein [Staphylococcus succinus]PTJ14383.1 YitT family protein [Staphylococcus succinus]
MKMIQQLFHNHTKNIIVCLIGSFISAIAVNCFILGSNLGDGGTVGISLALKYAFGFSPALTSLIINTIVIIVGWKFLSRRTAIYTFISNTAISIFLDLTEGWHTGVDNFVVNATFGGVLVGIGIGLVIASGGVIGGTSVVAKMLNKYFDIKTSQAIFVLDGLVVLSFIFVLPLTNVLFTIIMLFITERATSFIIEGFNPKKAVTIISSHNETISDKINSFTGRGSTLLNGKGGYGKNETSMLYVVVPQSQVTRVKKLVNEEDENAFLVIHDVRDVLGNGFMNLS